METPIRGLDLNLERLSSQKEGIFVRCKDFLCPQENRFREWFPTFVKARIRAKALDPYGFMKEKKANLVTSEVTKDEILVYYKCQGERCHATLVLRKVRPDSFGNTFGLYGCLTHQHSIVRDRRSEIIFKNKVDAQEFYDKNLKHMYRCSSVKESSGYRHYECRRKNLKEFGQHPCESTLSFCPTFSRELASTSSLNDLIKSEILSLSEDEFPYSILGVFYHSHKNDEKYNRDEAGGWKKYSAKALKYSERKRLADRKPRIRNGKVFPLSARKAGITVEDLLKSRVYCSPGSGKKQVNKKPRSHTSKESDT